MKVKPKHRTNFFPKKITFDKGEKLDQKSIVQKFNQLFVNLGLKLAKKFQI